MDEAAVFRHGKSLLNEALSPSSRDMLHDYFTEEEQNVNNFDEESDDDDDSADNNNTERDPFPEQLQHNGDGDNYENNNNDDEPTSLNNGGGHRRLPGDHALAKSTATSFLSRGGKPSNQAQSLQAMMATSVFASSPSPNALQDNTNGSSNNNNNSSARTFVQIECDQRPFCMQLSINARGEILIAGFTSDPTNGGGKGTVERTGLIAIGDVLVAVNDEMDSLIGSVDAAAKILMQAQLPVLLTFRRVPVVKNTLGEYTKDQIARNLELHGTKMSQRHGVEDAASIIKACIDVLDDHKSMTPLIHYVQRMEQFLHPSNPIDGGDEDAVQRRCEELRIWIDRVHQYVDKQAKEQQKKYVAAKSSNFKRIEMIAKQRDSIRKRLDKMRSSPSLLHPENHVLWQDFIELRHLASQLTHSVEQAKQDHFLPQFENYALRFGSDGVYVGLGDLWIASFIAKFTIESRASAPHVVFHLSTPSTKGLKLRCTNVKLATEGRLPSFQCDELNIEAQLVADIPFVFDAVSGWSVPQDELHVKLQSFSYYERRHTSVKRGADHDTVIKLFINRLLPSVVQQAAQNLFCVELGPLLESRNALAMLSGEIKIEGRPVALYDAPLNTSKTGASVAFTDFEHSEEARRLTGLSGEEADAMAKIFKSVETSFKKRGFVTTEHSNVSLRVLSHYFDQAKHVPYVKPLLTELWSQSLLLLLSGDTVVNEDNATTSASSASLAASVVRNVEQLHQYPVDVSLTLSEVTFRVDLCEAAATYYATLQRVLRHRMNSVSVGLSNMDALKDGSFFELELSALDEWYDKINRVLSYVTTNVDDLGVVLRGGVPAGFHSKVQVEAQDLSCKGPCTGSFTIPLTDFAKLQSSSSASVSATTESSDKSFSGLLHERNALVFSKFFTGMSDGHDEKKPLPSDRVSVSIKDTSARILFELPSDLSKLTPGARFVPFEMILAASQDDPPTLRFESGEFAKCQYKAKQIKVSGSMWRLLKRSQGAVDEATDKTTQPLPQTAESDDDSVWTEYLDSPFFNLKFHFLTSCQVTRDHIFWSLKSASLSHPNVVRVRHRICLVELLQDIGMASLVDSRSKADKTKRLAARRHDAQFRRALFQKLGNNDHHENGDGDRATLDFSTLSAHETLFSHNGSFASSVDDDDANGGLDRGVASDKDETEQDEGEEDVAPPLLPQVVNKRERPRVSASIERETSVFF